jgi:PEGA domain
LGGVLPYGRQVSGNRKLNLGILVHVVKFSGKPYNVVSGQPKGGDPMRASDLQVPRILLGILLCCLIPVAVAAEDEDNAKDPSAENSTPEIQSRTRVYLGGVSAGGFYRRYSGFDDYPYYPYSSAFWGMPYPTWPYPDPILYHPGYYSGFSRSDEMGEVKLQTSEKTAEVFLDGAYAGVAADLKSFWLEPGAYTLEVRGQRSEPFKKRIYVLSGKTVRVSATLTSETGEVR